jgi:hypothetical protein
MNRNLSGVAAGRLALDMPLEASFAVLGRWDLGTWRSDSQGRQNATRRLDLMLLACSDAKYESLMGVGDEYGVAGRAGGF